MYEQKYTCLFGMEPILSKYIEHLNHVHRTTTKDRGMLEMVGYLVGGLERITTPVTQDDYQWLVGLVFKKGRIGKKLEITVCFPFVDKKGIPERSVLIFVNDRRDGDYMSNIVNKLVMDLIAEITMSCPLRDADTRKT